MSALVKCSICSKLADPKLNNCPHCGCPLQAASAQSPPVARGGVHCPTCQSVVKAGDIVCVRCGTNLLTGQRVTEESDQREPLSLPSLSYVVGAVVVVLVIALVGGLFFVLTQSPVRKAASLARQGNVLAGIDYCSNILKNHHRI